MIYFQTMEAAGFLRNCLGPRSRATPLYLDFLAPRLRATAIATRRCYTSDAAIESSSRGSPRNGSSECSHSATLSKEQRDFLDSALRVNQAGELAATLIYTAQTPPIVKSHPHLRPLMKHMYDQEAGHFKTFNELLAKHRIRPTAMYPVWQAAATFLGWSTAVMGREAAMACTEAVETEIGSHYNDQIRVLLEWLQNMESRGEEIDPELKELVDNLKRIRDEELEHLDHAVENDAKKARPYEPLTDVIRYGCRGAIWISERI